MALQNDFGLRTPSAHFMSAWSYLSWQELEHPGQGGEGPEGQGEHPGGGGLRCADVHEFADVRCLMMSCYLLTLG